MRPPICEICGGEATATIAFADYRPLPDGMTGHPRGVGWFCARHLAAAEALRTLPLGAAVLRVRARRIGWWLVVGAALVVLGLAAVLLLS